MNHIPGRAGRRTEQVVINADDFGIGEGVSTHIARCFEAGVISSTTIMANMPGFEAAAQKAREAQFAGCVGVHLNLTCGVPLTGGFREYRRSDGSMHLPVKPVLAPTALLREVAAELRAQLARVINHGIAPSHIDSHEHILNSFPYARVAIAVARERGIRRMRLTRNAFYSKSLSKTAYKYLYNRYLQSERMRAVDWFTDVKPYFEHWRSTGRGLGGAVELMTHPGMRHEQAVEGYVLETDMLLSTQFREMLNVISLVPYTALTTK